MKLDVVLVDIIGAVISSMKVPDPSNPSGFLTINYQYGAKVDVVGSLLALDYAPNHKSEKFPLFAMFLPILEKRGRSVGYYTKVKIPRIVIACASAPTGSTDDQQSRYETDGTFKTVLYPCYYEFLTKLGWSPSIIGQEPSSFEHQKRDNPGIQPVNTPDDNVTTDYVDQLEILNLEIILNQLKTC